MDKKEEIINKAIIILDGEWEFKNKLIGSSGLLDHHVWHVFCGIMNDSDYDKNHNYQDFLDEMITNFQNHEFADILILHDLEHDAWNGLMEEYENVFSILLVDCDPKILEDQDCMCDKVLNISSSKFDKDVQSVLRIIIK